MKKLFSVTLILFSLISQAQNLKTTIDNNILGQGIRGVSALKLRNVFSIMADSIQTKYNANGGNIVGVNAKFSSLELENRIDDNNVDTYTFDLVSNGLNAGQSLRLGYAVTTPFDSGSNPSIFRLKNANFGFSIEDPIYTVHTTTFKADNLAILPNDTSITTLPVYSSNAAAISGGLAVGRVYRTSTGQLMIVY